MLGPNLSLRFPLTRPLGVWRPITPSDTTLLSPVPQAIYVGTSASQDLSVVGVNGVTVVFKAIPVGYHFIQPRFVNATGTTASNILGLF